MSDFNISRKATIPRPLDEVFEFFSDAKNLELITPPWLRFRIVTPAPILMEVGTRIEYRLSIRGLPVSWISEISVWDPPHRFVDRQIKGPYQKWVHEHRFRSVRSGTEVEDSVAYDVLGGYLVNRFLVRPDVERIFDYRQRELSERLGVGLSLVCAAL